VLADDSSSPRDNLTVTNVKLLKNERVEIEFSDRTIVRLEIEALDSKPVAAGDALSAAEIEGLVSLSETIAARKYAVSLVSRGRYTRRKLREKLLRKSTDGKVIERVLDELEELALMDDRSFALDWLSMRLETHPEGKRNLYYGLLKKGIDKQTAGSALGELVTFDVELEAARKCISMPGSGAMTKRELVSFLYKRGFSSNVVREAVKAGPYPDFAD
jgi:regulatory protein